MSRHRALRFALLSVVGALGLASNPAQARLGPASHCAKGLGSIVKGKTAGYRYKNTCDRAVKCDTRYTVECNNGWAGDFTAKCSGKPGSRFKCKVRGALPARGLGRARAAHELFVGACRWRR